MKLFYIKFFIIVIFTGFLMLTYVPEIHAWSPVLVGRVVTSTGAPVEGVWVKWKVWEIDLYTNRYRYAKTDANGSYTFPTWYDIPTSEKVNMLSTDIDTNLDGAMDDRLVNLGTYQTWTIEETDWIFSCGDSPHSFQVVPPVGMNGNFSSITGIKLNNGQGTLVLDDIVYTSNVPVFTPTPTPTGLTTKVVNFGIVPASGISGTVFIDNNMNGSFDPGENVYTAGATITVTGTSYDRTTSDGAGFYSFPNIPNGSYTIYISFPDGYSGTTPASINVAIPPSGGGNNFGMVSAYKITGNVFNDVNKNFKMDSGEPLIDNAVINSPAGVVNMRSGKFEIQDIKAGTYIISYTSDLPKGHYMLYPLFPRSFQVTVGPGCTVNSTTGASCSAGNITDLNFALSDSWPWIQTYGLDARFDNGVTNLLPASTACGGGSYASGKTSPFNSPGIIFSGDSSTDFGQGSASNKNWVVGGISYPEVFNSSTLKTSTNKLLAAADRAGIPIKTLGAHGSCQNPATRCNLQGLQKGFYHTTGNLVLDYNADFITGNYVIVVDGDINIVSGTNITVTNGATLVMSAGRDIIIHPSVSALANTCPVPAGQLQGLYSANNDIIIEGNNGDCAMGADKMLNVDGAFIVNATKSGGGFQNKRDLCAENRSFPSLTFKARPDFILNTPGFLTVQQTVAHEENP